MKTTIEINGYEIVVEETEGVINVSALKDGETVEEFELETSDEGQEFNREEEDDFEDDDIEGPDEEEDEEEPDFDEDDEDEIPESPEEGKLESFNSFIKRRK